MDPDTTRPLFPWLPLLGYSRPSCPALRQRVAGVFNAVENAECDFSLTGATHALNSAEPVLCLAQLDSRAQQGAPVVRLPRDISTYLGTMGVLS